MAFVCPEGVSVDIEDLCSILQCVGFRIAETKQIPINIHSYMQKSIEIRCNISGISVILDTDDPGCNCPEFEESEELETWEVCATTGGVQMTTIETNSTFKRSFSTPIGMHIRSEMTSLVNVIRAKKASDALTQKPKDTSEQKAKGTPEHKAQDTLAQKAQDTSAQKAQDTPAQQTLDTLAQKAQDTSAQKAQDTPVQQTLDTLTQKAEDTSAQKAQDTPAQHTLDTPAQKTLDTPTQKVQDTPTQKAEDTPAPKKKSPKQLNNSDKKAVEPLVGNNLSISSSCLLSPPPNIARQIKIETPGKYRSLDTLCDDNDKIDVLPEPGILSASRKSLLANSNPNISQIAGPQDNDAKTIIRQNTFTTNPSTNLYNSLQTIPTCTSSPISNLPSIVKLNLHQAQVITEDLLVLIQETIKSIGHSDSKSQSFEMDVSKISVAKSQILESRERTKSMLSVKSTLPYSSSPNLSSTKDIAKFSIGKSKKRLSYRSPAIVESEMKANSLKRSIPKKFSSIKSISPNFTTSIKKTLGVSSVLENQVAGSYKSLTDKSAASSSASTSRSSFRKPDIVLGSENEPKKKNLYSHIKSTIPKQSFSAKK